MNRNVKANRVSEDWTVIFLQSVLPTGHRSYGYDPDPDCYRDYRETFQVIVLSGQKTTPRLNNFSLIFSCLCRNFLTNILN
jgi:hypothetical protein